MNDANPYLNLIQCLSNIVDKLKTIHIKEKDKNNLQRIIQEYSTCLFGKGDVIASNVSDSFFYLLESSHCCWIDFIGSDSFSGAQKKQVFFSTVSMANEDLPRRKYFLNKYNRLLKKQFPVDVFVQLFFKSQSIIEGCIKAEKEIKAKYDEIQNKGLLIAFSPNSISMESDDIVSTTIVCKEPIDIGDKGFTSRIIGRNDKTTDEEIIDFISSIAFGTEPSPLVKFVTRLNRSLHSSVQFLYFIPVHGANGAFGLYCYGASKELTKSQRADLSVLVHNILFPFVAAYKSAWESKQLLKESIKSAVSSIMSRNMSHNLGSHCIYYTRNTLESLADRISGHGPEIRGAALFMSYIQARMDFLATLVSGEEYPYGSVNLKSQLFDVLTVDDFSKRHYESTGLFNQYSAIRDSDLKKNAIDLVSALDNIVLDDAENKADRLIGVIDSAKRLINTADALSFDNANKRTTNFLLENLIKSEHFSRNSINSEKENNFIDKKRFYLYIQYDGDLFTGFPFDKVLLRKRINSAKEKGDTSSLIKNENLLMNAEKEELIKAKLSSIGIAMPGGIMSSHAFFNIVENLIRNSAKHRASDFKSNELITTIDIRQTQKEDEETGRGIPMYQFTIFDNKANASKVYPLIIKQLKELKVLEPDSSINKKSKGLKEMLVSTLWLKSNEFHRHYSDILSEIDWEENGNKKLKLIRDYAFEFVKVDRNGIDAHDDEYANLGLRFCLPIFERRTTLSINDNPRTDDREDIILAVKNRTIVCADIIEIENEKYLPAARSIFPRCVYAGDDLNQGDQIKLLSTIEETVQDQHYMRDTQLLYHLLKNRFGPEALDSKIVFTEERTGNDKDKEKTIYFRHHFNTHDDFSSGRDYLYADSVSGGNFTVTLRDNYLRGITNGKCRTWKDKYLMLKIIESALTRITIIDERLSDTNEGEALTMKNIRVLNMNATSKTERKAWVGNEFKDKMDQTLFLSIHLGLIEKIIGNDGNWFMRRYNRKFSQLKDKPDKAAFFMDFLRQKFGCGKEIFISIHSGRGNYSYELEHSLRSYPFINLSAIESVFSNSKYLLAQLFYNTTYIGKGQYNQIDRQKEQI